jgi:hypothetical protein
MIMDVMCEDLHTFLIALEHNLTKYLLKQRMFQIKVVENNHVLGPIPVFYKSFGFLICVEQKRVKAPRLFFCIYFLTYILLFACFPMSRNQKFTIYKTIILPFVFTSAKVALSF